jgi:hypothetical protein
MTAVLSARAKELKLDSQFQCVIKAYEKANKAYQEQSKKKNTETKQAIPFHYDGKGNLITSVENFLLILRNDEFFAGLKFNLLSNCPEIERNGETERWSDIDDSMAREYIEKKYHIHHRDKLEDALRILFHEKEYHPIKDII